MNLKVILSRLGPGDWDVSLTAVGDWYSLTLGAPEREGPRPSDVEGQIDEDPPPSTQRDWGGWE